MTLDPQKGDPKERLIPPTPRAASLPHQSTGFQPISRGVLLGEPGYFVFVEFWPWAGLRGNAEKLCQQRSESFEQRFVVERLLHGGSPQRALEEESVFIPLLSGPGDFLAGNFVNHVEKFGAIEAHPGGQGTWLRADQGMR